VGEYLAAGLPMICIEGVGDVDELLRASDTGVLLGGWDHSELRRGVTELWELIHDGDAAERARTAARENLSLARIGIPAYDALYRSVSSL
jgi:hypothetical protein